MGFVSLLFPGIIPLGLVRVEEETRSEVRDPREEQPGRIEELVKAVSCFRRFRPEAALDTDFPKKCSNN